VATRQTSISGIMPGKVLVEPLSAVKAQGKARPRDPQLRDGGPTF